MAGNRSARITCSRRQRWWLARMATVFGVAIAALASCQSFRETKHSARSVLEEFAELDDCVNHGGTWSTDTHRCERAAE